ncbi:MAG: hypothetical protein JOZ53_02905 [Planctomycetaceae bacterium]|nr:hypothetical protein [Planctomycetaceae bacterium]
MCIDHETKLTFTGPVYEAVLEVRMASSSDEDQTNLGYQLRTNPTVPGTSSPLEVLTRLRAAKRSVSVRQSGTNASAQIKLRWQSSVSDRLCRSGPRRSA